MALNLQESDLAKFLIEVMGEDAGIKTFGRYSAYLTGQFEYNVSQVEEWFKATEPIRDENVYGHLITVLDMKVAMLCPHHLLPVEMVVHVGYIPKDKILGLSKFARVAKEFCKPPRTQEEYTAGLAHLIAEKLNTDWCMVMVKGIHSCMRHRGVESTESITWTNCIIGDKIASSKNELMGVVFGNHR